MILIDLFVLKLYLQVSITERKKISWHLIPFDSNLRIRGSDLFLFFFCRHRFLKLKFWTDAISDAYRTYLMLFFCSFLKAQSNTRFKFDCGVVTHTLMYWILTVWIDRMSHNWSPLGRGFRAKIILKTWSCSSFPFQQYVTNSL